MQRVEDLDGLAQALLHWADAGVVVLWRHEGAQMRLVWTAGDTPTVARDLAALADELARQAEEGPKGVAPSAPRRA